MKDFFTKTVWLVRSSEQGPATRACLHVLRTIILTFRCFCANKCTLRASALTFYTLLSIIPLAALAFAVSKGFYLEGTMKEWIVSSLKDYPAVAEKLIEYSSRMLEGAREGIIAGAGVIFLFFSSVNLMMHIERAFNDIWGIRSKRPMFRKISDYLAVILLLPILLAVCGSASAYAIHHFEGFALSVVDDIPWKDELLFLWSHALPVAAGWIVFSFLFVFIPNTRVSRGAASAGALTASILCHLTQTLYISAQFMVGKYNAIYGGFAAFPLFLIWLHLSWTFILLGVQISFASQNVHDYEGAPGSMHLSGFQRTIYALRILRLCAVEFDALNQPVSDEKISSTLEIPIRLTREVLMNLTDAGLLSEVITASGSSYQVAVPPEKLTFVLILRRLQESGSPEGVDLTSPACVALSNFWASATQMPQNAPITRINM